LCVILNHGVGRSNLWALLSLEPSAEALLALQAQDFPPSNIEGLEEAGERDIAPTAVDEVHASLKWRVIDWDRAW